MNQPDWNPIIREDPTERAACPPVPERQIIHELCLIAAKVHEWGSESGAWDAMPEWMQDRYRWALVQARDSGAVQS